MRNQLGKQVAYKILSLLFLLLFATGCGPDGDTATPQNPSSETAYPSLPLLTPPPMAYPDPEVEASKPLLALDKPLLTGNERVTGVGPPGLTVELINITFMGEILGIGVVGSDGAFVISVDPLPGGIRVGLSADVESMNLTPDDFQATQGTISVPQVGHFFDSAVTLQN